MESTRERECYFVMSASYTARNSPQKATLDPVNGLVKTGLFFEPLSICRCCVSHLPRFPTLMKQENKALAPFVVSRIHRIFRSTVSAGRDNSEIIYGGSCSCEQLLRGQSRAVPGIF